MNDNSAYLKIDGWWGVSGFNSYYTGFHFWRWSEVVFTNLTNSHEIHNKVSRV